MHSSHVLLLVLLALFAAATAEKAPSDCSTIPDAAQKAQCIAACKLTADATAQACAMMPDAAAKAQCEQAAAAAKQMCNGAASCGSLAGLLAVALLAVAAAMLHLR